MSTVNENYFEDSKKDSVFDPYKEKDQKDLNKKLMDSAKELEKNIVGVKEKQIKLLKISLIISIFLTVLLTVAITVLSPLKTAVPYLIRVDSITGYVDKVEPYNPQQATVNEAITRYFIGKYVTDRESYDWWNIQVFYDFVKETSSNTVFTSYNNMMKNEETSPLKVLNKNLKMNATVNSITFLNDNTAQVRFTKNIIETTDKQARSYPSTKWVATVVFNFNKPIKTEKQRLLNPLGFSVDSYKLDAETN